MAPDRYKTPVAFITTLPVLRCAVPSSAIHTDLEEEPSARMPLLLQIIKGDAHLTPPVLYSTSSQVAGDRPPVALMDGEGLVIHISR